MKSTMLSLSITALVVAVIGCRGPFSNNLPPAEMIMHPGPGVDGPGPGVMMYQSAAPSSGQTSQVYFVGPQGMVVTWDVSAPTQFDSQPLVCPGRYNFSQGAIYRLKLTNIPGRPGVELYPTLEVGPAMPRTEAFLSHNPIPVQLTEEDFDQVLSGNFVSKVIYLPDPEFQELALAGVETLVSTRLDPGMDPIVEADRRGAILAIVRIGGIDLQIPSDNMQNGVLQASYSQNFMTSPQAAPMGTAVGGGGSIPTTYISGVTAPQYGMPMSGTPIGLPGPPHIPLGIPAGLQKHVIKNHTRSRIPGPTKHVKIDVRQIPGHSYPKPADHVRIVERSLPGLGWLTQPFRKKHEVIRPDRDQPCPTGGEVYSDCSDGQGLQY